MSAQKVVKIPAQDFPLQWVVAAQVHNELIAFVLILLREAGVRMGWSRGWLLIMLVMW